jgi:predicted permease
MLPRSMVNVLGLVAPVFALILLGYGAALRRLISPEGLRGLNDFAFYLAAPALLFAGASQVTLAGGRVGIVFFAGVLVIYAAALVVARLMSKPLAESAVLALNASFGNTFMLGLPVVVAAYGNAGLSVAIAIVGLNSLLLLPLTTVIAEIGLGRGGSPLAAAIGAIKSVLRNPIVVAVAAGLAWAALMPPVPDAIRRFLELLGNAMPPVALFCLGASLKDLSARREALDALVIAALKLLALPLAVWLLCRAAGLAPLETAVAVAMAATPTGANAFLLARRYAVGLSGSGAAVVLTTALSVLTLSAVLIAFPGR